MAVPTARGNESLPALPRLSLLNSSRLSRASASSPSSWSRLCVSASAKLTLVSVSLRCRSLWQWQTV